MPFRPVIPLPHQRADRGRGGVKSIHPVLLDDLPKPVRVGMGRNPLEQNRRRPVNQRPVDDVAVTGHPADIGGAPEEIARVVVEHILEGGRRKDHIAGGGVQDPLRLSGGA